MTTDLQTKESPEIQETSQEAEAQAVQRQPITITGPEGEPLPITRDIRLVLGIEKFTRPSKHYRLIWTVGRLAWPYEEVPVEFRRKQDAVTVGQELAKRLGVKFSDVTR